MQTFIPSHVFRNLQTSISILVPETDVQHDIQVENKETISFIFCDGIHILGKLTIFCNCKRMNTGRIGEVDQIDAEMRDRVHIGTYIKYLNKI
jgi:hypothetical protein